MNRIGEVNTNHNGANTKLESIATMIERINKKGKRKINKQN